MTTRLLGLLCGLLAIAVAAEATYRPGLEGSRDAGTAGVRLAEPRAKKLVTQAAGLPSQWMAVALGRPLFAPDRKPTPGALAADPGMPRLTGIIEAPEGSIAIFQPKGSAKSVVARAGERVGNWEVTSIGADAVNLRKESNVVVLSPRFDGVQHDGAQDAKKAKTRWEAAAPTGLERARWSNPQLQP
jgi:hypothetical protein